MGSSWTTKLLLMFAMIFVSLVAYAQNYPSKPIRFIVPSPPGVLTDILMREIATRLKERSNWMILIDNKVGGNNIIAVQSLLSAPADGYSVMLNNMTVTLMSFTQKSLPFDVQKDLQPIAKIVAIPLMLASSITLPARNISELVAYSKANPGKLNIGGNGVGTTGHLGVELFKLGTGLSAVYVPYVVGTGIPTDLLTGRLDVGLSSVQQFVEHIKTGRMRPLVVFTPNRIAALPETPTSTEFTGREDMEVPSWYGYWVKAGTPLSIVKSLERELLAVMKQPEVLAVVEKLSLVPATESTDTFEKKIISDMAKWQKVIDVAKLKFD